MKKYTYSPITFILSFLTMFYITWNYWSVPVIIFWAFYMVFYVDKYDVYRRRLKGKKY